MNYLMVMPKRLSQGASTNSVMFPIGIAYVSASLKQAGFCVYTSNLDFEKGDTFTALKNLLTSHHIDVVCTGGLSLDWRKVKDVIDASRTISPKIITVVGGGIISSDPETAMNVLCADIGVIGEGEQTICELASAMDNGNSYKDIHGLIYRSADNEFVITPRRQEIKDLDSIPFPDYDGFHYGEWLQNFGGSGTVLSDRSCPFQCTFCFHPTGEKYRQRSLDNIFKEIEFQKHHYSINHVVLQSELFSINKTRVKEFCERIKQYGLTWSGALRVTDVDKPLLQKMKDSGCKEICFGLESADNTVLKSMRKGTTVEQIANALDIVSDVGIATDSCNFIFGDINETTETVANTLNFWWKYNKKTHINLALIQTYPGTYLYKYACDNGIITDKEKFLKDGCPIVNVSKLSQAEFKDLTSLVTELRLHEHVPAESVRIAEIDENGNCKIAYTCRKCGAINMVHSWFWFKETWLCPICGVKNEVDAFRDAMHHEDAFFSALSTQSPVVLWGAGGIYYKLINQYSGLASNTFLLVDGNAELHGLTVCKKEIFSPNIILQKNIKNIVIMALSHKDQIYAELRTNYPSVENIYIPMFDITPQGVVPMLRNYARS